MSQCRAPNCSSKDYEGCQIKENSGTCSIKGTVPGVASAFPICHPKSISDSWSIDATKCVGDAQFDCEENKGCAWTMGNHLKKKCELASSAPIGAKIDGSCAYTGADAASDKLAACRDVGDVYNSTECDDDGNDCTYTHPTYSCSENVYDAKKKHKYDLIDPDTFGCDRTNCEYRTEKKVLEPGECVRNDSGMDDSCSGFSIERCHNDVVCSWKPNDEGYCGYSRYIEYQLNELTNSKEGVDEISNLGDSTNDVCLSIQNPGREECELKGCIWDIYGDRTGKNPYNTPKNMDNNSSEPSLTHYYDISTSGLCVKPITDNCMGYFCSRHSGVSNAAEVNYDRPDGKCEANSGDLANGCVVTNTEIVGTKTPGLITYLPPNFPSPGDNAHIPRTEWNTGGETDGTTKITALNYLLGTMYNQNQGADAGLKKDPQTLFHEIYKDNCEYNMNYPSSKNENSYQYGYKTYDYDSDLCIGAESGVEVEVGVMCSDRSFYHKNMNSGTYSGSGICSEKSFDSNPPTAANVERSDSTSRIINRHDASVTPTFDKRIYELNTLDAPTVGTLPTFEKDHYVRARKNIECRNIFYEIVGLLENKIGVWDGAAGQYHIIPYNTSNGYYPKTPTGVEVLIEGLIDDFNAESAAEPTKSAIATGLTAAKDNPGVYGRIKNYIVALSNQLQMLLIHEDEYKHSVARYLASFVHYTSVAVNCVYNPYMHEYVQYMAGGNEYQEYYQYLAEELPVKSSTGSTISYFLGKETLAKTPTIEKTLKVKDMIYKTGNAVVTLQLYDSDYAGGKKIEFIELYDPTLDYAVGSNFIKAGTVTLTDTTGCTLSTSADLGATVGTCADVDSNVATCAYVPGVANQQGDAWTTADSCTSTVGTVTPTDTTACTLSASADLGVTAGTCADVDSNVATCAYVPGVANQQGDAWTTADSCMSTVVKHRYNFAQDVNRKYENLFEVDTHKVVDKTHKLYVGGMLEFEISGVDPGCFEYDPENRDKCQKHITLEGGDDNYMVFNSYPTTNPLGGTTAYWRVKEVRFKDVPMDIYFQGDIDGLFKVNDLISITDFDDQAGGPSIVNLFNQNNIYDTADPKKYYQKVISVDIEKNKITVENAIRRGPYFIGRADLEEQYHGDAKSCVKDPNYGSNNTNLTKEVTSNTSCDFKELYDYCSKVSESACATENEPLCEIGTDSGGQLSSNAAGVCIPKLSVLGTIASINYAGTSEQNGLGDAGPNVRCNETFDVDIPLQKTRCPVIEDSSGGRALQYEDMIRSTASGAAVAFQNDAGKYYDISLLSNPVPLDKLEKEDSLKNWRVKYISKTADAGIVIKEGIIEKHVVTTTTTPTPTTTHKIKITNGTVDEEREIYILSFRPPHIYDYLSDTPSDEVKGNFDINVGIFAKKDLTNPLPGTCVETAGERGVWSSTGTPAVPETCVQNTCEGYIEGTTATPSTTCPAGCTLQVWLAVGVTTETCTADITDCSAHTAGTPGSCPAGCIFTSAIDAVPGACTLANDGSAAESCVASLGSSQTDVDVCAAIVITGDDYSGDAAADRRGSCEGGTAPCIYTAPILPTKESCEASFEPFVQADHDICGRVDDAITCAADTRCSWNGSKMATKELCDYNNGVWKNHECKPVGGTFSLIENIRASDLCERTGFNFDEKTNVCKKELEVDSSITAYCTNKTDAPGPDTYEEKVPWNSFNGGPTTVSEKYPCSVCDWKSDTHTCEALPRKNCTLLNEDECGSQNHRPGTTSVPSACEYYRHNMEPNEQDIRQSDFECGPSDVPSTSSTCSTYQTLETCEPTQEGAPNAVETGCEWQCPLAYGADNPGYTVTHQNEGQSLQKTILGEITRDNYYSPDSIRVECSDGYEVTTPNDTSLPKAQCVGNSDDSTVGNHSEILGFVGCVKELKCQNSEFTPEKLQIMFSKDSSSVPSEFITFNELDQGKFPDVNGNFRCPLPSRIINEPEYKEGWGEDTCCTNIGLCTNNDVGIDVICPEGQVIKMTYYEGNTILSPHIGTTPEECCAPPEVPTITVPLDADYDELMADETTFKENFISDIVGILNSSDDITFLITPEMIEFVAIDPGSIIVTFKVRKSKSGEVVLKEQIAKTLTIGKTFQRVGAVTKGEVNFKEYNPGAKFDYYSKAFGIGISNEELVVSIIITFSLCFFCLVVMGMLMK